MFEKYVKKQVEGPNEDSSSGTSTEDESNVNDISKDEDDNIEKDNDSGSLTLCTLSDKDSLSEINIEEQDKVEVQNIVLSKERIKANTTELIVSLEHIKHGTKQFTSNKTEQSLVKKKSDKNMEVKTSAKKNDIATCKVENNKTTIDEGKVCKSSISNESETSNNVAGTVTKIQEVLPTARTNCADTDNKAEGP